MSSSESLYVDIWNILKEKGKCKVAANPALHKRIIHAVINKKYYDLGFKLLLIESHKGCKIRYVRGTNFISFELTYYYDFKAITERAL